MLTHPPDKSSDSPTPIDPERAAEVLKRAILAHQHRDFAGHLAAKRQLIDMGVGITFQTAAGWEPTHA
jgi:hypothetical protein